MNNTKPNNKLPVVIREWISKEFGSVRTLMVDDTIWMAGMDVVKILGHKSPTIVLDRQVSTCDKWLITPKLWKTLSSADSVTISNPNPRINKSDDYHLITISSNLSLIDTQRPLPIRGLIFINLSGVWSLVMKSKTPNAKVFQDWVTSELIPAIHQHGTYIAPETLKKVEDNSPQLQELLNEMKGFKRHINKLEKSMKEVKSALKDAEKDVKFVKEVLQSDELLSTEVIAKDYGQTSFKFNRLLRTLGVHYFRGGRWLLKAKFAKLGWKHTYTYNQRMNNGVDLVITQTKWTHKGRRELMDFLLKKGIHPIDPAVK